MHQSTNCICLSLSVAAVTRLFWLAADVVASQLQPQQQQQRQQQRKQQRKQQQLRILSISAVGEAEGLIQWPEL